MALIQGDPGRRIEITLGNKILRQSTVYIKVDNPINLSQWVAGTKNEIAWESAGTSGHVNIDYVYGGTHHNIAQNVADNGSYYWTLPTSLAAGSYQIYIEDAANSSINASSASFTVLSINTSPSPTSSPGFDVAFILLGFLAGASLLIVFALKKQRLQT